MKRAILAVLLLIFLTGCVEEEQVCITDEDCIPADSLVGVKYICVDGLCKTRPLGNPATEFCLENGFITESRQQLDGGVYSLCKFPDGTECEEWMFFNRQCVPGDIKIKIDQLRFIPEELHLKAGTTVTWENYENEPHQVMNDPTKDYVMGDLFDSERLESIDVKEGPHEFSYTFNEPGEYKYHCHIHTDMKGKIIVS